MAASDQEQIFQSAKLLLLNRSGMYFDPAVIWVDMTETIT